MSRHDITSNPSRLYRHCSAKGNGCQQWRDKMVEKLWSRKYHWPKETRCQRSVVVWNLGGCVLFCLFRVPLLPKKTTELPIVYGIITVVAAAGGGAAGAASLLCITTVCHQIGWMMNEWWFLHGYTATTRGTHTSSAWCSKDQASKTYNGKQEHMFWFIIYYMWNRRTVKQRTATSKSPSMALNRHLRPSHKQSYTVCFCCV